MSETIEYIDNYFEKKLSAAEKQVFEQRCTEDENFAGEVAFYISSREAIHQTLLEQKKMLWSDNESNNSSTSIDRVAPVRRMTFQKWLPLAAAGLLLAIAVYLFYPANTPHQLAGKYIKQSLTEISQTMDGSKDSLQKAIVFYNTANYDSALVLLQGIYQANPNNNEAKEYIGRAYLMKKDYGNALTQFDELAGKKLFSNPGIFLKAVTLLERNNEGDKEAARKNLEQVVQENLEGNKEAKEWLKKW